MQPVNAALAPAAIVTDSTAMADGFFSRQLFLRIGSALIMAPIALAAVYGGDLWLASLALLVGTIGTYEWNGMSGVRTVPLTILNALIFITSLWAFEVGQPLVSLAAILVGSCLCGLLTFIRDRKFIWPVWGQAYIGLAILSIVWLQESYGWQSVIWLLLIIWAMDIGAYFAGKTIGGPKLAPRISPKKTWAGLIGGTATAGLVSWLAGGALEVANDPVLLLAGVGLGLWSQVGDLIESQVKRHFGVKDSGAIIPGHGGVLDRIDSLLFTLPVMAIVLWLWPTALAYKF